MQEFILSDRYRLELHWDKVRYNEEGICNLTNARFLGPALAEAQKLNNEDYILIDFFQQYLKLVRSVYVVKFSWKGVSYDSGDVINLGNAKFEHASELNRVPKLKDTDKLIIDTSNHTVEKHAFNIVYKAYVLGNDRELYRFGE
jgi:hypothetical protein